MPSTSSAARPIGGSTALVGVLGDPVRHSLSPAMHNAALAALGLDWVYLALPATPEQLASVVSALAAMGCQGLNVTIPHKQAVAALCRACSPLAERLGAVNTLVPHPGGGWFGTNTDVEGFAAPLRQAGRDWSGGRAVVLGHGGSARAVVAALVELDFATIQVAGRRPERLAGFVSDGQAWAAPLEPLPWNSERDDLRNALASADLVVNTTPVGMAGSIAAPDDGDCPLTPDELQALRPDCWVYDIIYTPRPTRLLRQASLRGCRSIDGLEMLVQQGAAALRLWSGSAEVPVAVMREAVMRELEGRR